MPELPEVETTRRGIEPHIQRQRVSKVIIRQGKLRWPVPRSIENDLPGKQLIEVERRGKYLLLQFAHGTLIIHLGMSGSLRILESQKRPDKHDHVDIEFKSGTILRYTDPRKFGCVLWQEGDVSTHALLTKLGPEPLTDEFDGNYLFKVSRNRKSSVKTFLMDGHIVVGVGNIYANEALFKAGINPNRAAGAISSQRYDSLVQHVKVILANAIAVGGTTLKDFTDSSGSPGYFSQSLNVYGRAGLPCMNCDKPLKEVRIGQRSTVYCTQCQR